MSTPSHSFMDDSSFFAPDQPLHRPHRPCRIDSGRRCAGCIKLKRLELEVVEAEHYMECLLDQYRQTSTEINRAHNPLILRTPPEVVSLIFRYCYPSTGSYPPSHTGSLLPEKFRELIVPRLKLGAVCREWRKIAWATPQLWAEIAVRLERSSPNYDNEGIVRDWLMRSGALPLTILVKGPKDDAFANDATNTTPTPEGGSFEDFTAADATANTLSEFSDRWGVLEMKSVPEAFLSLFRGNSSSRSILRALSVGGPYSSTSGRGLVVANTVLAPTRIILNRVSFKLITVDWTRVTNVRLEGRPVQEYIELLRHASSIEELEADFMSRPVIDDVLMTSEPIVQTHLRHLLILDFETDYLAGFLEALACPSLTTLNITNINEEYMETIPTDSLKSFLRRSGCSLDWLRIHGTDLEDSNVISLLESVPSLTGLSIRPVSDSNYWPKDLFRRLERSVRSVGDGSNAMEEDPFLPALRHLVYDATEQLQTLWCRHRFRWDMLPAVFCPLTDFRNRRGRPFHFLEIYFNLVEDREESPTLVDIQNLADCINSPHGIPLGANLRIQCSPCETRDGLHVRCS